MSTYIIHSTIIWSALLGLYYLVFRRYTFFQINRVYLVLSLLAGLIIPIADIPQYLRSSDIYSYAIEPIVILGYGNGLMSEPSGFQNTDQSIGLSLLIVWSLITLATSWRFIASMLRIFRLVAFNETQKKDGYIHVILKSDAPPFSFLKYVFISDQHTQSPDYDVMLVHEMVHIRQKHTLDILLVETIKTLFWFNPMVYFFKTVIAENHEFIADEVAAGSYRKTYSQLLIQTANLQPYRLPVNSFIQSPIQNRIKMMYKNRSKPFFMALYLSALPLVFVLALLGFDSKAADLVNSPNSVNLIQTDTLPVPPPPPPPPPPKGEKYDEVFKVVEEMPRFPGCEDVSGGKDVQYQCSMKKLMEFIAGNLKYPENARKKGLEGTVMVQFIVNKDGSISDMEIIRDIGSGCGDAVIAVLNKMQEMPQKWIPGKQRGKKVRVLFTLPVKFALNDKDKAK